MPDDEEYYKIVSKVIEQKERIHCVSQLILKKLDEPHVSQSGFKPNNNSSEIHYIRSKFLEIYTAFSNIGMLTDNVEKFNQFIITYSESIDLILQKRHMMEKPTRELSDIIIKQRLNILCSIGFYVKKLRGKYIINLPNISFSLVGTGI